MRDAFPANGVTGPCCKLAGDKLCVAACVDNSAHVFQLTSHVRSMGIMGHHGFPPSVRARLVVMVAVVVAVAAHLAAGATHTWSPAAVPSYAKPPVELHNPAEALDVWHVTMDGSGAAAPGGVDDRSAPSNSRATAPLSIRQQVEALAPSMNVSAAPVGVTVLGGNWGATEVARAAYNDTIDTCVARPVSRHIVAPSTRHAQRSHSAHCRAPHGATGTAGRS